MEAEVPVIGKSRPRVGWHHFCQNLWIKTTMEIGKKEVQLLQEKSGKNVSPQRAWWESRLTSQNVTFVMCCPYFIEKEAGTKKIIK